MNQWKTIGSELAYDNPYFRVWAHEVEVDSHQARYYVLERGNFAIAVPVISESFVMVRQYRYAIKRESLEFPMGGCEGEESYETCARRELIEEAGYQAGKMTDLGELAPTPGHSCQMFRTFLAEGLEQVGHQNRDQLESDMEIEIVKIADLPKLVEAGEIIDGPTLCAWAQYLIHQARV